MPRIIRLDGSQPSTYLRAMLCLQIKCVACGHFGRVFDRAAVMRFRKGENPGVICSRCKNRRGLEISRAWWIPEANPLDGARADKPTTNGDSSTT